MSWLFQPALPFAANLLGGTLYSPRMVLAASTYITASGENTTAQLTYPSGKSGLFTAGRIQDDENPADTVDIASGYYTEMEWCIKATAEAVNAEVYEFRVTKAGVVLNTYTVTPQWTIGAGGAYTLNLEPGTYGITGGPATELADRMVNAASGAYTLTGFLTGLSRGYFVNAAPGTYSITGSALTELADRMVNAAPGAYTITGAAATFLRGLLLNAGIGSYSITGTDLTNLAARLCSADPGTYSLSGQNLTALADRVLSLAAGSYTITGQPTTLLAFRVLATEAGGYAIVGLDAGLIYTPIGGISFNAEAGSYSITSSDASLFRGFFLNAESGVYVVSGVDAEKVINRILAADPGAYIITGNEAFALAQRLIVAEPGAYSVTGSDLIFPHDYFMDAEIGTYIIVGSAAKAQLEVDMITGGLTAENIADIADAIRQTPIDMLTLEQTLKTLLSHAAGKASGGGTATLKFRDQGDTKDVVTMSVDVNGNRTAVVVDAG